VASGEQSEQADSLNGKRTKSRSTTSGGFSFHYGGGSCA
jgi:hypothetical protein